MIEDKIKGFEGFIVSTWEEEENKYIEIKLEAYSIIINYSNSNENLYKLVIDNVYTLSDMQNSVVVFEWLKSFWKDLDNNLTVTLLADEAEDDSVYNYEEIVEIFNKRVKTIKASCDYYKVWIDSGKNWVFEIDGVRLENHSNISRLNDFQGDEIHYLVPKEYKTAMKIIVSKMFKNYARIQEIIAN